MKALLIKGGGGGGGGIKRVIAISFLILNPN